MDDAMSFKGDQPKAKTDDTTNQTVAEAGISAGNTTPIASSPPTAKPPVDDNSRDDFVQGPPVPPATVPANPPAKSPPVVLPGPSVGSKKKEYPPFAPPVTVTEHEVHDTQKADEVAKAEGDEYWEQFAREIELEKEIAEMGGVQKVESGEVKLPKDLADQMGIKASVTIDTPIAKLPPNFSVRGVVLDDIQLSEGEKKPPTSAFRWLAEWFILQLKKAHFMVKMVKGKVFRQLPPAK